MKTVPRVGRLLDLAGMLLFLGGGAAFVWAWLGFRGMQGYEAPVDAPAWSGVQMANEYWRVQKIGAGFMIAGVVVFVTAWWVARRIPRAEE